MWPTCGAKESESGLRLHKLFLTMERDSSCARLPYVGHINDYYVFPLQKVSQILVVYWPVLRPVLQRNLSILVTCCEVSVHHPTYLRDSYLERPNPEQKPIKSIDNS